jgi:hypothetical protein
MEVPETFEKVKVGPAISVEEIASDKIRAVLIEMPSELEPALLKKHKLEDGTFRFKKGFVGEMKALDRSELLAMFPGKGGKIQATKRITKILKIR